MSANVFSLLIGCLLAVGAELLSYTLLDLLLALFRIRSRGRLSRLKRADESGRRAPKKALLDELFGLDRIPWNFLYLAGACCGFLLAVLLGSSLPTLGFAIALGPLAIHLVHRSLLKSRRKGLVGEVRALLVDLRMLLALRGSLLLALQDLARVPSKGVVMRRVQVAFQGGRPASGLEALEGMAGELASPHLGAAVQRLRAAQGGVVDLDQALATAIQDISDEMNAALEERMEQLPMRITFTAVPFLLGPVLILILDPLADLIIRQLAGPGSQVLVGR